LVVARFVVVLLREEVLELGAFDPDGPMRAAGPAFSREPFPFPCNAAEVALLGLEREPLWVRLAAVSARAVLRFVFAREGGCCIAAA
jgi:hypothetical protein